MVTENQRTAKLIIKEIKTMIDKIKNFCKNKIVRLIAIIMFAVSVVVLVLGGITEAELTATIKAILVVLAAIGGFIGIIGALINKDANNK